MAEPEKQPSTVDEKTVDEKNVTREPSASFVKFYANTAKIQLSLWDFRLTFGEAFNIEDTVLVEESATILMSPQHAKAFAGVLAGHILKYEELFGEIHLPEGGSGKSTPSV